MVCLTIESDHKPLESISQKNLAATPVCLQHMLLCLQGYDYTIHYCASKEMALSDTLSWFSLCPGPDIPLDITIHHACLSPERKKAFQQAFVSNPKMSTLADMIITGWPNNIKAVPTCYTHTGNIVRPSSLKMALSYVENPSLSSVTKGDDATTTPPVPSRNHQIPDVHMWMCLLTSINKAIEEAVWQCETCTHFQAQNATEPLTPTPTLSHPWQMCATDIFTLEGIDYLICGNFYSKTILI